MYFISCCCPRKCALSRDKLGRPSPRPADSAWPTLPGIPSPGARSHRSRHPASRSCPVLLRLLHLAGTQAPGPRRSRPVPTAWRGAPHRADPARAPTEGKSMRVPGWEWGAEVTEGPCPNPAPSSEWPVSPLPKGRSQHLRHGCCSTERLEHQTQCLAH